MHEPPDLDLLRGVVDRHVRRRLEEADLPHAIAADAAGRQVGDAAVGEPQPRVGDVDAAVSTGTPTASIDSTSDCDQRQHDVEVVNHQIEHDVDVEAALGKRAEPMDFDEPRIGRGAAARRRRPD